MKLSATCKKCGGKAEFAGFVSLPRKTIFSCPACGHQSWFDGAPADAAQVPKHRQSRQQQPQPRQQQPQQQQQPQPTTGDSDPDDPKM